MWDLSSTLTVLGTLGLAEALRAHLSLERALVRGDLPPRPEARANLPPITVIRPVKGVDTDLAANLGAAFAHAYPGEVETLFVLDDEQDPAFPFVEAAVHRGWRHGQDVRLLLAGEPHGMTGKLHAMEVGLAEAKHDLIAFADSDTRAPPGLLEQLVRPLLDDEKVGATFAPVVVRPGEGEPTSADVAYALMLNGLYTPEAWAQVDSQGNLRFIMGQFMAFRRETLDVIGLRGTEGELVDDMSIGLRLSEAGFENRMIHTHLPIIERGLTWPGFMKVYERWIMFSRRGIPADFKWPQIWRVLLFFAQLLLAATGAALGAPLAALLGLAGAVGTGLSINALHEAAGGAPVGWRHAWVVFAVLLVSPFIFLEVMRDRKLDWRGRVYDLDSQARLAAPTLGHR